MLILAPEPCLMFAPGDLYSKFNKYLHYIYLVYAIPMICIAAIITPPFQNPDEPNHFARAEQVSRLEFVPVFKYDTAQTDTIADIPKIFYPDNGGFDTDKGIFDTFGVYYFVCQNPKTKVTQEEIDSAKNIKWGTGKGYRNFGNTAIYPPVTYLMPAIGIAIGKLLNVSVITTLYVSRLLGALLAVTLCFFALKFAKGSGLLMFIVMLFPMPVALFGAISPDAILISCSFLLVAIIDNVEFDAEKVYTKQQILVLIVLMCVIGVAKPPYILFAFVFLFLKFSKKLKVVSVVVPVMVLCFWLIINHANFLIKFAPADLRVSTKMQVANILHHPFEYIGLFFKFDWGAINSVIHMFVGVLGWLDAPFPVDYYHVAYIMLLACIIISIRIDKQNRTLLKTVLLLTAFATLITVITAQYVTWTSYGSHVLSGMQGRYLLPIFPFVALGINGYTNPIKVQSYKNILYAAILVFPLYTCINIIVVLLKRYY